MTNAVPEKMPLPVVIESGEEAFAGCFPDDDADPTTVFGAAFLWYQALISLDEHRDAIEALSTRPADWDGYRQTARDLDGWCITSGVIPAPDDPRLAYVKLIPDMGHCGRVFAEAPLDDVYVLTLARCDDGLWRVWGLSRNYLPPASRVWPDR